MEKAYAKPATNPAYNLVKIFTFRYALQLYVDYVKSWNMHIKCWHYVSSMLQNIIMYAIY